MGDPHACHGEDVADSLDIHAQLRRYYLESLDGVHYVCIEPNPRVERAVLYVRVTGGGYMYDYESHLYLKERHDHFPELLEQQIAIFHTPDQWRNYLRKFNVFNLTKAKVVHGYRHDAPPPPKVELCLKTWSP